MDALPASSESESMGLGLFLTEELWKDNKQRGWATLAALLLILIWQFGKWLSTRLCKSSARHSLTSSAPAPASMMASTPNPATESLCPPGISDVSEADLKSLIDSLDEKENGDEKWENVIEKCGNGLTYKAKCCKPKDGPIKYLSMTLFEDCSPETLRDFYMDNDFRKQWDKTVVEHEQIYIDETTGIEIGRTIKKFPLLTPREYVLVWRVWEGKNNVFYCLIKECDHPLAPRSRKYVRVERFRSGWRIRQVPGTNVCEIKMVHQEDAGLNVEMARLAFAKGIWSYVCKMDNALRKYCSLKEDQSGPVQNVVAYIQKVPDELEDTDASAPLTPPQMSTSTGSVQVPEDAQNTKELKRRRPSKKLIANGLLLLGGLIYLSNSRYSFGTKVGVALVWKKLSQRLSCSPQARIQN